jgi:hypothetical protein
MHTIQHQDRYRYHAHPINDNLTSLSSSCPVCSIPQVHTYRTRVKKQLKIHFFWNGVTGWADVNVPKDCGAFIFRAKQSQKFWVIQTSELASHPKRSKPSAQIVVCYLSAQCNKRDSIHPLEQAKTWDQANTVQRKQHWVFHHLPHASVKSTIKHYNTFSGFPKIISKKKGGKIVAVWGKEIIILYFIWDDKGNVQIKSQQNHWTLVTTAFTVMPEMYFSIKLQ